MAELALLGGRPVRAEALPRHVTIGPEEEAAVLRVMREGALSAFYGSAGPEFYGGPEVRAFEREWAEAFEAPYAVSMNSATSCLYAAVGALEAGPGDEVIVTPYTMSATAAAILVYNAIPVFADIDEETFCLDPAAVERAVTPRTRGIIVTDLFGQPADLDGILRVARRHSLWVIEDAAQAPGVRYRDRWAGTLGDIGVYSLNCHKAIQTGEGGMCVTADPELAKRLQLIRNHAEAVVGDGVEVRSLVNMLGWNYRLTELQAAVGREQLRRLRMLIDWRADLCGRVTERLAGLPGIEPPPVRDGCTHGYYVYAVKVREEAVGIPRDLFVRALQAEGLPFWAGYLKPLYHQPLYQQRVVYGKGCPFTCGHYAGEVKYGPEQCPITERVQSQLICSEFLRYPLSLEIIDQVAAAFEKVVANAHLLAGLDPATPRGRKG